MAYACPKWTLKIDSARGLAMRGIAGGQMAIMAGFWRAAHVVPAVTCSRGGSDVAGPRSAHASSRPCLLLHDVRPRWRLELKGARSSAALACMPVKRISER